LGHAARAAAVMESVLSIEPSVRFDLFTTVPRWFFEDSVPGSFSYYECETDIGLKQEGPFRENLAETLSRLDRFIPYEPDRIRRLSRRIAERDCRLILCDISPMGISAAKEAGIPSVLIENFTWDWIYAAYSKAQPGFESYIRWFEKLFDRADYRIQTEPVCLYRQADLSTRPVCRKPRRTAEEIRDSLGIGKSDPVIHITMGGIPGEYRIHDSLRRHPELTFMISGGENGEVFTQGNVIMLPYRSTFYHPDLIHAADVVVGKAGYSTLAEVYYAGVPFVFVNRPTFRESEILSRFICERMNGLEISADQFESGVWLEALPRLLQMPVVERPEKRGAVQAAEFLLRVAWSREHRAREHGP